MPNLVLKPHFLLLNLATLHTGSLAVIQRLVHDRELQLYDGTRLISGKDVVVVVYHVAIIGKLES